MKKCFALILTLLVCLPFTAFADTANGTVQAQTTYDITAPHSGTLLPFDLNAGDFVEKEAELFTFDTAKIYAPQTGIFAAGFAQPGDNAHDVIGKYNGLCVIEDPVPHEISATYQGAASGEEFKFVHVGETLFYELSSNKNVHGEARVIAANQRGYTLELSSGSFKQGNRFKLYRNEKRNSGSCVGTGTIRRSDETYVQGTGRIITAFKQDGDTVEKGDLLYETVNVDCPPSALTADILSPTQGVLSTPNVISGQQVYKGQTLVTLHDTSALKVVAQVDEIDLHRLSLGDTVSLLFDAYPAQPVFGVVSSFSLLGVTQQNAAYYDVDITFTAPFQALIGMNVTVTLP